MHQSYKPNKQAESGFWHTLSMFFQDLFSGFSRKEPAYEAKPVRAKRWSSSTLTKAPGRIKPIAQHKHSNDDSDIELKRAELENMVREGVCLDGTYLAFADFSHAFLSNGRFRGSNLAGANLARAIVVGGNFMDANLRNACLVSADLRHCNFHYADLSGANLRGANLAGADLSGANLWGADLFGANLEGALLAGSTWNPPTI